MVRTANIGGTGRGLIRCTISFNSCLMLVANGRISCATEKSEEVGYFDSIPASAIPRTIQWNFCENLVGKIVKLQVDVLLQPISDYQNGYLESGEVDSEWCFKISVFRPAINKSFRVARSRGSITFHVHMELNTWIVNNYTIHPCKWNLNR